MQLLRLKRVWCAVSCREGFVQFVWMLAWHETQIPREVGQALSEGARRDMHPLAWKFLHSVYVLQNRWVSLRADTCQLPKGHTIAPYYVLEYPPWVTVVALTTNEQVVLVRQYRHGVQQTLLELSSGAVDATDASPSAAVKR